MLKKWKIFDYEYNFSSIADHSEFLNTIKDIATLLLSFYEDIPNKFYFYKEDKYEIRFSENQDLLKIFEKRLPDLYSSFMKSLNNDMNLFENMINQLFIDKVIFFERKIVKKKIISTSNYHNISNMVFNDKKLLKTILNFNFYSDDTTIYSGIKKKINRVYNLIQESPTHEKIFTISNIIQSLNGREGKYYFEERFLFSWAVFIIMNGNSSWLSELKKYISKNTYQDDINFLVLGVLLDDVNILAFYCDKEENINTIINNPYNEIKKINYDYVNYQLLDNNNISLLSLSTILASIGVFNYLVNKADVNYLSGKYNESAIFFACKNTNFDFIKLLVDNGCDLKIENIDGNIASELLPLSQNADAIFKYLEDKRKAS